MSHPYDKAWEAIKEAMKDIGWQELKGMPEAENIALANELLKDVRIQEAAEQFALQITPISSLSGVVEPILQERGISLDGRQFFDLIVEIGVQAGKQMTR